MAFNIRSAQTEDDLAAIRALFAAYAASLPVDLGYQDFAAELAGLPGKYAAPRGALLLARSTSGQPLGCVAMRPLDGADACEMKRLFAVPDARGLGLGLALAGAVIAAGRTAGYRQIVLDTLPSMKSALDLYGRLGFTRISAYYAPTPTGTVFLGLDL